jgi:hypothetical protein
MQLLNRAAHVRKGLVARSIERRRAGAGEIQRKAAGRLPHSAELPVPQDLASHAGVRQVRSLPDRQVPDEAVIEDVGLIEVSRRIIAPLIDIIQQAVWIIAGFAGKPEGLSIGIRVCQREAARELVIELDLESVVVGVVPGKELGCRSRTANICIGTASRGAGPIFRLTRRANSIHRSGVLVVLDGSMDAMIAHVSNIQNLASRESPLVSEIPRFEIRVFPVQVDRIIALVQQSGCIGREDPVRRRDIRR